MSTFRVELKKVVDDTYDVQIGYGLQDQLMADLKAGLVGKLHKFAVITDSIVEELYAKPIYERLLQEGYQADLFVFPEGEKSKTREVKAQLEKRLKTHEEVTAFLEACKEATEILKDKSSPRFKELYHRWQSHIQTTDQPMQFPNFVRAELAKEGG